MKEKEAFEKIKKINIFSSEDLKRITASKRMTYIYIKKWLKEIKIVKLPFFLYSPIDPETSKYKADLFELACKIEEDAFLVLLSASKIHNLKVPDINTIYVSTSKRFNVKKFDGWTFKPRILDDSFGIEEYGNLRLTNYTRTVLEMIREFNKYMNLYEFLDFLKSVKTLDSENVKKTLEVFDSNILYQKIGYLVDIGLINVYEPDYLINFCFNNIGKSSRFFCKKAKIKGSYNTKWQLVVPEELRI